MYGLVCLALMLAGGIVGVWASTDRGVSLQKFLAVVAGAVMFLLIGWASKSNVILRSRRRRRISPAGLSPVFRGRFFAALRMTSLACSLPWLVAIAGLAASVAGNVLVDRNAWKLNALNQPVYAVFAHFPRVSDLAFSQNGLAAFLVLAIPFACALSVRGKGRWLARVLTAGLIAELLLTDSRAATLSLALASSLVVVYARTNWRWLAVLTPLIAIAAIAAGALGTPSTSERLAIWESALYMLADHPVTGVGLGMFQRVYPDYILPAFHNTHPHAHNLFLQSWLDMGVLGAMGMLGLSLLAVTAVARLARRHDRSPVAIAAAVSTVAVLVHAQVDSYFAGDPRTYWLMFVPLGLLMAEAGPFVMPQAAWFALALPFLLLTLSQAPWLVERRWGLETGDPQYLRAALNDGPQTQRAHFELAEALFVGGDKAGAVKEWRLAKAAPYLLRQGRPDLALAVDPNDSEAQEGPLWTPVRPARPLDKLGRAAEMAGNNRQAKLDYEVLSKDDPVGFYRLAELSVRAGEPDQAIAQLEMAVGAIPNQEDFRLALAQAYLQSGDQAKARQQYASVLDVDPGSQEARRALGAPPAVILSAARHLPEAAAAEDSSSPVAPEIDIRASATPLADCRA